MAPGNINDYDVYISKDQKNADHDVWNMFLSTAYSHIKKKM